MNEAVSNLNDVVIRIKTGEHDIFNDRTTQEQATSLCIDIVKGEILHMVAFRRYFQEGFSCVIWFGWSLLKY